MGRLKIFFSGVWCLHKYCPANLTASDRRSNIYWYTYIPSGFTFVSTVGWTHTKVVLLLTPERLTRLAYQTKLHRIGQILSSFGMRSLRVTESRVRIITTTRIARHWQYGSGVSESSRPEAELRSLAIQEKWARMQELTQKSTQKWRREALPSGNNPR